MECLLEEGDVVGEDGEGGEEEDGEFAVSVDEAGQVTVKEVKKVSCGFALLSLTALVLAWIRQ